MPSRSTCATEIESLHDFFVDWYAGTMDEDNVERLERALASGFEMVTPDGDRRDRAAVLEGIRGDYARDEPGTFAIEIRNVELVAARDDHATVRYEEWQTRGDETTGRISTVLFREDAAAPGGVVWLDLHETWLDGENERDS